MSCKTQHGFCFPYYSQNHIAVGRLLRTLESHSRISVPHNTLRRAFYHFCALRKYSYGYFCYRCGDHPPILIGDMNWKVAFDLPGENCTWVDELKQKWMRYTSGWWLIVSISSLLVHLMRRPDMENCSPQDTQVNVAARWENLKKEIIATGFCEGKLQRAWWTTWTCLKS